MRIIGYREDAYYANGTTNVLDLTGKKERSQTDEEQVKMDIRQILQVPLVYLREQHYLREGIIARAYWIPASGAMPVCPPARRDYTKKSSIKGLEIKNVLTSVLTAVQHLIVHEYPALVLERRSDYHQEKLFLESIYF